MENIGCGCGRWIRILPQKLKSFKNSSQVRRSHSLIQGVTSHGTRETSTFSPNARRWWSSVLYASHYREGNLAVVEVDLNLVERFSNIRDLFENVRLRKMNERINVYHLASMHKTMKEVEKKKVELENEKKDIAAKMADMVKMQQTEALMKEKEDLIAQGKIVREDLKNVNRYFYQLEEEVILYSLQLPSDLHHSTPTDEDRVIKEMGQLKSDTNRKAVGHLLIGKKTGTIFKKNVGPNKYYLRKGAAELEQDISYRIGQKLRHDGFTQMSCPDMVKTIVVEGTGLDGAYPENVYVVQDKYVDGVSDDEFSINRTLHLAGASPQTFAAAVMRMNIQEDCLPLKWFSIQRSYDPSRKARDMGLFCTQQNDIVELFGVGRDSAQADTVYEEFITRMWEIYGVFKDQIPMRLVARSPPHLRHREAACVDMEAWSYSLCKYIKVGSVSTWSDFLSRQLMVKWSPNPSIIHPGHFVHTVHGTAVNITVLVGLLMEAYQTPKGHFTIPKDLLTSWSSNSDT